MPDITLQSLIDAATAAGDGVTPAAAVATVLADNPDADVAALQGEALARFDELAGDATTADAVAAIEALADVIDGTRTEQSRLDQAAQEQADRIAALQARVRPAEPAAAETDTDTDAEGADTATDTEPVTDTAADTPVDTSPSAADPAPAADAPATETAIAASAKPRRRVRLADLPRRTPAETMPTRAGSVITAAADVAGFAAGQTLDLAGVAAAANSKFASMPRGYQPDVRVQNGIARIHRTFPDDLIADGRNDEQVIDHAASMSRLPGGSLVAAGGWCAPSETDYSLGPGLADANAGLIDVPEVQAARGGLRFTEGPDYTTIWSNIGWGQTEAQAIAGTGFISPIGGTIAGSDKPCYRVPCPAFDEVRAEPWGFCVVSGILQNDAYPELTKDVIEKALIVNAHRINMRTINRMVAAAGAPITVGLGVSAVVTILNTLDLMMTDYRYLNRMPDSAVLEVLLPLWLRPVMRADTSVRNATDLSEAYDVTDARIEEWFSKRKARPQWVYDWQDAFSGVAGGFGSQTPIMSWPDTVDALMYPAGTYVRARGDVLQVDALYDTKNLPQNDYQAIWAEEKLLVIKRRYKARLLRIPLAANGVTGAAKDLDSDGKAA